MGTNRWESVRGAHRGWSQGLGACLVVAVIAVGACSRGDALAGWCDRIQARHDALASAEVGAWRDLAERAPGEVRDDAQRVAAAVEAMEGLDGTRPERAMAEVGAWADGMGAAVPRLQGVVAEECGTDLPRPELGGGDR